MKTLYIVRGLPGSGKSTMAKKLVAFKAHHHEADQFYVDENGNYNFDISKIGHAHTWCQDKVRYDMSCEIEKISVSNTFTTMKEVKPYLDLCNQFAYTPFIIVCENNFGNIHSVPEETLTKMKNRFQSLI